MSGGNESHLPGGSTGKTLTSRSKETDERQMCVQGSKGGVIGLQN